MTTPLYDDSNWREEYKSYTSNKRHLELLENGAKSLYSIMGFKVHYIMSGRK